MSCQGETHASQTVKCVAYEDGRKVADILMAEIPTYLTRPHCFVWAALLDPPAALVAEFQRLFGLHPLAVEDAGNVAQRPKIEEYGDALFAVLKLIEPATDEFAVGELAVFLGHNYVLSIRSRAAKGFQDVRERCEREPDMLRQGPGYILYALIDAVVDRYFPLLDALEDDLDVIEQRIFTPGGTPQENIEAVYALKQRLMVVKHAVSPLLEGVSNLSGARVPVLCAGLNVYFRDIYDHLQRLNQTADSLRDTVATAMSVNLSMVTLQESETMKQLAAYAALLAVPTMIAGIYGMNFAYMPELKWHYGYPLSIVVMGLIDVWLYWRFKKANWL
jgi:magnesium transporter